MMLKVLFCLLVIPLNAHIHTPLYFEKPEACAKRLIRVLLKKFTNAPKTSMQFQSSNGFLLTPGQSRSPIPLPTHQVKVKRITKGFVVQPGTAKPLFFTCNDLTLEALDGPLTFRELSYQGKLNIVDGKDSQTTLVINTLDLEEYVYSVLPREIYQSWPLEMHKVQAIATRTYAVHCIQQNLNSKTKKRRKPYDIRCTNHHQTYCGTHPHEHVRRAIENTRGIVLSHKGKAILAMFDSCCGGAIPADIDQHDFEKAPYLARKHPCTFCKDSNLYSWERNIEIENFIKHLKDDRRIAKKLPHIGSLVSVSVAETDKAGLVKKLLVRGKKKLLSITSTPLYSRMRSLFRSLSFSIKRKQNTFVAHGKGYGHQVGLCQIGARELVRRGWHHQTILRFYYPQTKLCRVC